MVPKWFQNGSQNGPRKAARGSPKTTWGPCVVPGAPGRSWALLGAPALSCIKPFFVVGFGFALVCVFGFGCLRACCCYSFVRWCCVFMCACFFVVCFVSCCCVFVLFLRLRDVRRVPCSFWGHLKETCDMFQDVSVWFSGDADSF